MLKNIKQLSLNLIVIPVFCAGVSHAAVQNQPMNSDHLAVEAEFVDEVINSDSADDVRNSSQTGSPESPAQNWEVASDSGASGGDILLSPPSPHKQTSDTSHQESVAVYRFTFERAGTYKAYFLASNNGTNGNGSSDSFWGPADFGTANPSVNTSTGNTGDFNWLTGFNEDFVVAPGDLGLVLEFRLGVRENGTRMDAIVLSLDDSLSDSALDAILAGTPVPTPTPTPTPTPIPTPTPTPGPCGSRTTSVSNVSQFNDAVDDACPGDTIVLSSAGNWNNVDLIFDGRDTSNSFGGSEFSPITLTTESPGDVLITGESTLSISGNWMVVDGLHFTNGFADSGDVIQFRRSGSELAVNCRLTNSAMIDFNPPSASTNYKWISVYGTNNRIDHCYFSGMNHIGVLLTIWPDSGGPPNATRIDNNHFNDRIEGTGNGFETIRIGTSDVSNMDSNAIVENNLFTELDGEIEIISNKSVGNIYRNNTFIDSKGQLTLRHGSACVVNGNFFLGNNKSGSSGVRIIGPDHIVTNNYFENTAGDSTRAALSFMNGVPSSPLNRYLRAERNLVAFNTFVNCKETIAVGVESSVGDTTLAPIDNIFANNVVIAQSGDDVFNIVNEPLNQIYEGNIIFGGTAGISPLPSGITSSNPMLQVAADGLYRPATGSALIDAAVGSYPSITVDMDGQARDDGMKDIGADEVSGAAITNGPLTPNDVGPSWRMMVETRVSDLWILNQ